MLNTCSPRYVNVNSQKATAGPRRARVSEQVGRGQGRHSAGWVGTVAPASAVASSLGSCDHDLAASPSSRACSGRGLLGLQVVRVTRGGRLRCGSAERGTSGERACRGRPRRGGSAQRQEGGAAARGGWRPAAGRGERGPAARATCGAAWLPRSGDTVSPREFGSAPASAHTGSHPHTSQSARSSPLQLRPAGQTELLQFSLSPESRAKQSHCASERARRPPAPLGIKPSRLLLPHRVSQSLSR